MIVGVALGSNQGDRRKHLDAAVDFLRSLSTDLQVSSYYLSQPVDCPPGAGYFYNAVAQFCFNGDLFHLLDRLQQYELQQGREGLESRGHHAPRPIDLDILYADDRQVHEARLQVPHPRLHQRLFVLEPLAEINPRLVLPGNLLTISELLEICRAAAKDQICLKTV